MQGLAQSEEPTNQGHFPSARKAGQKLYSTMKLAAIFAPLDATSHGSVGANLQDESDFQSAFRDRSDLLEGSDQLSDARSACAEHRNLIQSSVRHGELPTPWEKARNRRVRASF
jgi:hypothetical protein